jgi:hypothetical protein
MAVGLSATIEDRVATGSHKRIKSLTAQFNKTLLLLFGEFVVTGELVRV